MSGRNSEGRTSIRSRATGATAQLQELQRTGPTASNL